MTIESVTGGSVSANKENPITFNESVTLTATPSSSSYTLCDINVKDGYNQLVALSTDAMPWYSENNTYSFSMPLSNATATPKFTNNLSKSKVSLLISTNMYCEMSIYFTKFVRSYKSKKQQKNLRF